MRDRLRYMWHAAVSDRKGHGPDTGGPISLSYEGWEFFCLAVLIMGGVGNRR